MAETPFGPELIEKCHPRLRVDRLRRALRGEEIDPEATAAQVEGWIALFHESIDPQLQVLILELLEPLADERVVLLAREAANHRSDGVRLEGLRILLDRHPLETVQLAKRHREDYSLEVRLLVAERLAAYDRPASIELCLDILDEESGGMRMQHAVERVCEHWAELGGRDLLAHLKVCRREYGDEDPEAYFEWCEEQIQDPDQS